MRVSADNWTVANPSHNKANTFANPSHDKANAFALLLVAFIVNGLAQADSTKIDAKKNAKGDYSAAIQGIFSGFSQVNYLAWFGIAVPLIFFADMDQTRDLAKAFIWLILIAVVIVRGTKAMEFLQIATSSETKTTTPENGSPVQPKK